MASIRPIYDRKRGGQGRGKPIGYEVRYRDAGGAQRTKGGFRRKRDAEAYVVDIESSRQQGTLIPHERASARFDEVAASWLASIEGRRKPKTVHGYQGLLQVHVPPRLEVDASAPLPTATPTGSCARSRNWAASQGPSGTRSSC